MASTGKAKPQLLNLPQLADIHLNHPPTAQALKQIVDYLNKNLTPLQGNKVAPR